MQIALLANELLATGISENPEGCLKGSLKFLFATILVTIEQVH